VFLRTCDSQVIFSNSIISFFWASTRAFNFERGFFLKVIGLLADRGEVRITDIAIQLGVSKPSVVVAVKVLEEQGFLKHERYRSVILTEQGKEKIAEIRGRYEFLVLFLKDILGVSPKTAEQDSCKMEHILSEETLKKMKNLRGYQG
jgi:DtxR family Mn-dependent transcriptional regulator